MSTPPYPTVPAAPPCPAAGPPRPFSSVLCRGQHWPLRHRLKSLLRLAEKARPTGRGRLQSGSIGRRVTMPWIYLSPVAFTLLGLGLITRDRPHRTGLCQMGLVGAGLVILGWLHLLSWGEHDRFVTSTARVSWLLGSAKSLALVERVDGGLIGALMTMALSPVGLAGSYIVLIAGAVCCALLITETSFGTMAGRGREPSPGVATILAAGEGGRPTGPPAAGAAPEA